MIQKKGNGKRRLAWLMAATLLCTSGIPGNVWKWTGVQAYGQNLKDGGVETAVKEDNTASASSVKSARLSDDASNGDYFSDGVYHYEGENHYSVTTDEGKAANFETGNGSQISINLGGEDGFPAETQTYKLSVCYCGGGDKSIQVLVNGESVGELNVPGCGWGDYRISETTEALSLKAGDVLGLEVPEGQYHWLDYLELKEVKQEESGDDTPGDNTSDKDYFSDGIYHYEGENHYSAKTDEGKAANFETGNGNRITINLGGEDGFPAETQTYKLSVCYCGGGDKSIQVLVNGESVGELNVPGCGWGDYRISETSAALSLKAGDVLELEVPEGQYHWLDYLELKQAKQGESGDDASGEDTPPVEDGFFLAKNYVDPADKITGDGTCANMDPGVKIVLTLDSSFHEGFYEMKLRSCGNARSYRVKINGEEADFYETTDSGFGVSDLHDDIWQGRYSLKEGDCIEIEAPDGSYGWIQRVYFQELPVSFYYKDKESGITLQAEEGVLPEGTEVKVKQVKDKESDTWFADQELRAVYYEIQLLLPKNRQKREKDSLPGDIFLEIPVPAGMELGADETNLYFIGENGPENLFAEYSENRKAFKTVMEENGVYAIAAKKGSYRYEAENNYTNLTDGGNAANFETGNGKRISIKLEKTDGFLFQKYNLLARYCGGGDNPMRVLVNGKAVGSLEVPYCGWGEYQIRAASAVLSLKPGDLLELEVPDEQYHWLDYLELKQAEPFFAQEDGVSVSAGIGVIPYGGQFVVEDASSGEEADHLAERVRGAQDIRMFRLAFYLGNDRENAFIPEGTLELRIALPDDFNTEKFCLYAISGQGQGMKCSKRSCRLEDGEIVFTITNETGVFALVNGAASLPLQYDGYAIYQRSGAKNLRGRHSGFPLQVRTRTEGSSCIYEGEAYYKALENLPAADLQPGAQMNIPLSHNSNFKSGTYRIIVRSNGNRQMFRVKVNGQQIGTISRRGTEFSMPSMTDDAMAESVMLNPSDVLTIEGEGGGNFGWVDYVVLKPEESGKKTQKIMPTAQTDGKAAVHYPATAYYEKKTEDGLYADLQPGESITVRAGDSAGFTEGWYRVAVTSNGNRTRLLVKRNGEVLGSIVRVAETGFDSSDITRDVLNRSIYLSPEDRITIEAPGTDPQEGPWGWVSELELTPHPKATGVEKTEFRYDGEDYYQASLYSPAADLQAGESIHFVLSDDPDFTAGRYRLSVLSNGTRERFTVQVNGADVGEITKKAADYSDIDYSQDYLENILALSPGDVLTITGQEGDYFGWVNYILLEKEE